MEDEKQLQSDANTHQENDESIQQEEQEPQEDINTDEPWGDDPDLNIDFDNLTQEEAVELLKKSSFVSRKRSEQVRTLRAKLEDKPKEGEADKKEAQPLPAEDTNVSTEDLFVISSHDLTQEEYAYAKKVGKMEDMPIGEAVKNPLFTTWRQNRQEEVKRQEASMGASKGSGSRKKQKTFETPHLSQDDHKELWKKRVSS
jgi:hypothetical protein